MDDPVGSGEVPGSIGKELEKGLIEYEDFFINSFIVRFRLHGNRRGGARRRRRGGDV